jgi:hypothetical protein
VLAARVPLGMTHVTRLPSAAPLPLVDEPHCVASTYEPAFTWTNHCQE